MVFPLALLALLGHASICVALINRMHGIGLPRRALRICDVAWYLFAVGTPAGIFYLYQHRHPHQWDQPITWLATIYLAFAITAFIAAVAFRAKLAKDRQWSITQLVSNHTHYMSVAEQIGHRPVGDIVTGCLAAIPGNQILDLSIHIKNLEFQRLDPALDGLSITHLTDLHFTGQLKKEFFVEVIRQANELDSDLVAITGDVIDKPECLSWIPEVLGKLHSRLGVYFVLGNHDKRLLDDQLVRDTLTAAGLIDLGGCRRLIEQAGCPILLAGNELPWYTPAANMQDAPDEHNGYRPFRILLTHTPDQLNWARLNDFDLMLAGHTHGGQVRFPLIGPILSPSRFGVRYASGTFHSRPTILHVSRGISGTRPLRLNCPPELTKLVLRSGDVATCLEKQDEH